MYNTIVKFTIRIVFEWRKNELNFEILFEYENADITPYKISC